MARKTTLTELDRQLIRYIFEEFSSAEIAEIRGVSIRTIEHQREKIKKHLKAKTTIGVIKYGLKNGIIKI